MFAYFNHQSANGFEYICSIRKVLEGIRGLTREQAKDRIRAEMKKVYQKFLNNNDLFKSKLQTSAFGQRVRLNQGDPDIASGEFKTLVDDPNSILYAIIKFN
jgi:hypothetical protein